MQPCTSSFLRYCATIEESKHVLRQLLPTSALQPTFEDTESRQGPTPWHMARAWVPFGPDVIWADGTWRLDHYDARSSALDALLDTLRARCSMVLTPPTPPSVHCHHPHPGFMSPGSMMMHQAYESPRTYHSEPPRMRALPPGDAFALPNSIAYSNGTIGAPACYSPSAPMPAPNASPPAGFRLGPDVNLSDFAMPDAMPVAISVAQAHGYQVEVEALEEMHARIAQAETSMADEYIDMGEYKAWIVERERKRAEVRADPDAPRAVSLPNFPYRHDTEALCNEYLSHVLEAEKERIRLEAALECSLECEDVCDSYGRRVQRLHAEHKGMVNNYTARSRFTDETTDELLRANNDKTTSHQAAQHNGTGAGHSSYPRSFSTGVSAGGDQARARLVSFQEPNAAQGSYA